MSNKKFSHTPAQIRKIFSKHASGSISLVAKELDLPFEYVRCALNKEKYKGDCEKTIDEITTNLKSLKNIGFCVFN